MIKWTQIAEKYIGKPYELGGWGNPGYDCFSLLIDMLRDSGLSIPKDSKWKGMKLSDYNHIWEKDKDKARQIVLDAVGQHLIEHKGPIEQGDVVLLSINNEIVYEPFLSIQVSNRIISSLITDFDRFLKFNHKQVIYFL